MDLWIMFLFLALVFLALGVKSGKAVDRTAVRKAPLDPNASQEQKVEIVVETPAEVQIPDVFDEDRARLELAAFARTPGIVAQCLGRARSGFTKAGERGIIRDWTSFFQE